MRYGFVDPDGSVVIPLVMALAYSYREGLALVRFRERRPDAGGADPRDRRRTGC